MSSESVFDFMTRSVNTPEVRAITDSIIEMFTDMIARCAGVQRDSSEENAIRHRVIVECAGELLAILPSEASTKMIEMFESLEMRERLVLMARFVQEYSEFHSTVARGLGRQLQEIIPDFPQAHGPASQLLQIYAQARVEAEKIEQPLD